MSEYGIPEEYADRCVEILITNGRLAQIIRDVSGTPRVILDEPEGGEVSIIQENLGVESLASKLQSEAPVDAPSVVSTITTPNVTAAKEASPDLSPRAIFVGHGKKHGPLQKLEKFLSSFQIPYKVVVDEANLGRPIPQKVRDTLNQCGSAILIFTCDEKFQKEDGTAVWRPSENVVYELGAASYLYGDRVVIFKEKGITFPTNYSSIGYIEFEEEAIDAKTSDLLKELVGFGLIRITPVS